MLGHLPSIYFNTWLVRSLRNLHRAEIGVYQKSPPAKKVVQGHKFVFLNGKCYWQKLWIMQFSIKIVLILFSYELGSIPEISKFQTNMHTFAHHLWCNVFRALFCTVSAVGILLYGVLREADNAKNVRFWNSFTFDC